MNSGVFMEQDSPTQIDKSMKPVIKPAMKPVPKKPVPKKKISEAPAPTPNAPSPTVKKAPLATVALPESKIKTAPPTADLTPLETVKTASPAPSPTVKKNPVAPPDSKSLLDSLYESIIISDSEGSVKTANIRVKGLLGYNAQELAGKNMKVLFPSLNDSILATIRTGVKDGKHTVIEMPCKKKDGTLVNTETSVSSMQWAGEPGMCFSMRDNTRHKEQESMLIAVNNAIANTASGIVVTNIKEMIEFVNPAFLKMTGNKEDASVIGRNMREFITETDAFEEMLMKLHTLSTSSLSCKLKSADSTMPVYISGSPNTDHDGKFNGLVFTVDDITVLNEAQEQRLKNECAQSRLDAIAKMGQTINSPLQKLLSMAELDNREDYRLEINHVSEIVQKLCQESPLPKGKTDEGLSGYELRADSNSNANTTTRLLILEDEEMIRNLFVRILHNSFPKANIELASSGTEALKKLSAESYSVVLLDVMVPDQNGEAVFREMVKIYELKQWPIPHVIFCTGFMPGQEICDIVRDGSSHKLLRKPVTAAVLTETVGSFLIREAGHSKAQTADQAVQP